MSEAYISSAVRELPRAILEAFGEAQDEIAADLAASWKGQIVALEVIDTGNYLQAVRVTDTEEGQGERTVMVEAPEARGYAGAIRRKGEAGHVGRRVAEQGIKVAAGDIKAALDRAGDRVRG